METKSVLIAFGITLLAGLATGLGSALAFFARKTNTKFLSFTLGFSAGVMIYVAFVDILDMAKAGLIAEKGEFWGSWIAVLSFFGGIAIVGIIDKLVPQFENPHEAHRAEEMKETELAEKFHKLYRIGLLSAVAIAIHNLPEGTVTFMSAIKNIKLGIAIGIAIAIHNVPEGIAVSIPIFYATGSRKKAFIYSFLSGMAEPLGALVGFIILSWIFSEVVFGIAMALVAGIMVFISLDELLPAAREYGHYHLAAYGLIAGMAVMAVSLLILI